MHKNVAHRYAIFFCSLDVEIYADDSLVGQLTNKNLIQLIITLSFYDYELKIIAEMAKTNSIVLPFASKAALSATPIKGQNTKQTKTKIETFILYQYATFILVVLARSASAAFTYLHS